MKQPFTIRADQHGLSIQQILAEALKLSNNQAKALLDQRGVFINGQRVWMCRHKVKKGDVLEITGAPEEASRPASKLSILYEDENCLVIDKPSGMLSNADRNSAEALLQAQRDPAIRAIHRLDRDTSGCLLFAKNNQAEALLIDQFKIHAVKKIYHTLVLGSVKNKEGEIRTPLDGQQAVTRYQCISTSPMLSYLRVEIDTGRTHQIRKHFAGIGYPVAGDKLHGLHVIDDPRLRKIPRQMLHAASLTFTPPPGEKSVTTRSPEPKDFVHLRSQFLRSPRG